MQIVCSPGGREKGHYEPPPHNWLAREDRPISPGSMRHQGINMCCVPARPMLGSNLSIHSKSDMLGRTRTAQPRFQEYQRPVRLYSLSARIMPFAMPTTKRSQKSRSDLNVTEWSMWSFAQVTVAARASEQITPHVLQKSRFCMRRAAIFERSRAHSAERDARCRSVPLCRRNDPP